MSDVSTLRMNPGPKPAFGYNSSVSGRVDPDISVDVGQPVTPDPQNPGQVLYAQANNEANASVAGLAFYAGEAGHSITVQYAGPMTQKTTSWDRVTGQTGGLTTGAHYYLSQTAGMLTTDPSGTTFTAHVGIAISSTTMLLQLESPFATSP